MKKKNIINVNLKCTGRAGGVAGRSMYLIAIHLHCGIAVALLPHSAVVIDDGLCLWNNCVWMGTLVSAACLATKPGQMSYFLLQTTARCN